MTSTSAGRKRVNAKTFTADDQALGQIAREAEAKLAAKRAARNEAREIRMRELEKQQKENEEKQDRIYELTNDIPKTAARPFGGGSSRRGSVDSTTDEGSRELRSQVAELDEKYKKAMMGTAQLHNEKQALVYEVEILKDQLEEREEEVIESQREFRDKCKELESKKRSYRDLDAEFKNLKIQIEQRDKLIEENGLAIVISDEGEWTLVKASAPNGPLTAGLPTMGMVNSRLAGEADTSLGTLKLYPKCLTANSATRSAYTGSSSLPLTAAAAAANDLSPSSTLPKQRSVGIQVSIDLPCLVPSKESDKSNFDVETISNVSSPPISSKSFISAVDSTPSQPNLPSNLYACHTSESSSLYVNKNSPPSSALDDSVWSDDDDEFYDAVNSVSDPMSPKPRLSRHTSFASDNPRSPTELIPPLSPKFRSSRKTSFTGGAAPCSPIESSRHLVFDDCYELFESSVDDSPIDILDDSVRSGMCGGSVCGHLRVSSVDPTPNQVNSFANSLINDVYNSIEMDQDGNLNVQPIQTNYKSYGKEKNPGKNLERVSKVSFDETNGSVTSNKEDGDGVDDSCNVSDSDEDHMPNFASLPHNASDDEDQMDTDIEYLEDSHPCVKFVPKLGESSCNEFSTDEEILEDVFGEDNGSKVVSSTPNKKMKKGYKYKTKSGVKSSVPNVCVEKSTKPNSYETCIGGDDGLDVQQRGVLSSEDQSADLQPLRIDSVDSVDDVKYEEQNTPNVSSIDVDDTGGNIPIVPPCGSSTSETEADIEREAEKLSPKISDGEPSAFTDEVHIANESDTQSTEVLLSETTSENITNALSSELSSNDPLATNQPLFEGHVIEEESVSLDESDKPVPFLDNADIGIEPDKATNEVLFGDPNTARALINDTDVVDSKEGPDETSFADNLPSPSVDLKIDNRSEKDQTLCDSEPTISESLEVDVEEKKATHEGPGVDLERDKTSDSLGIDQEGDGIDSALKASSDPSCVTLRDVTEVSLTDPNNNEGQQDSFRKEISSPMSSDGNPPLVPFQLAGVSSSSSSSSIPPVKDDACSNRAEKVSSMISDLAESSDEEEEDGAQLTYTDDDLFEILDSPMHRPTKKVIESDSPPDPVLPGPKLDDSLVLPPSNDGASCEPETMGQVHHSQNSDKEGSDSQKNKKAAGSKKLFGHLKSWKKKKKGSKK